MKESPTVREATPTANHNPTTWRIVLMCALLMVLDGYDLSVMGLALPAVAQAWSMEASAFRWALSASLVGVGVGSVLAGLLGDRLGRKTTLLGMFSFGGVVSLATMSTTSIEQLVIWRFLVGVGMGGAIPNVIALVSELVPEKRRNLMVVVVYSGAALGGGLGSLLASVVIPAYGWTSVFLFGGVAPLLLAVLAWRVIPESPAFMLARQTAAIAAESTANKAARTDPSHADQTGVLALFRGGRSRVTFLLWVLFICTQAMVFFVQSWYVTLLERSGIPLDGVLRTFSLWDFGALIGGVAVAALSSRLRLERLLALAYLAAAVCLVSLGQVRDLSIVTSLVTFLTGFSVVGASLCLGALAASHYPPAIRASGVGLGLGVGRVGAVLSPLLAGSALSAGWSNAEIFSAAVVPAIVAALTVIALAATQPASTPPSKTE
jgi:AAHS family 4-hydroxybenzoate transporter-like MFS transporter